MASYKQLPLLVERPSFRLLELSSHGDASSADNTNIQATIETYDLQDRPEYDALSYSWGSRGMSTHAIINDGLFPISDNLLSALKQLYINQRETGDTGKLWCDAICINQSDNAEKSHQVYLMRDIYANARKVLVWIGEPDHLSELAFDTLEQFAIDDGTPDGSTTCKNLQDTTNERRAAIHLFIERSYFGRMWVIQEVVVARNPTILCGSLSLGFDSMHRAIRRMTGSGFFPFSGSTTNLTYLGNWRESYLAMSAPDTEEELDLRLFLDSRDRNASDARDKIFSLQGIANVGIAAGIDINYDDSVERVYTDFAKHVLRTRQDLQILSAVILRHRSDSKLILPSYVPDWSLPKYGGSILQRYYRFKPTHLFQAAGTTKRTISIEPDSDTIRLEGRIFDTVANVIPIKTFSTAKDNSIAVTEDRLKELAADAIGSETYPFTCEPSWVAYFRTLTADRTALSPRINDEYRNLYFSTLGSLGLFDSTNKDESSQPSIWEAISESIRTIIEDKDMFVTTRGYLGLGHEGSVAGDVVCVLTGGEVPFLLRQIATEEKRVFRFLSECYVHGVMDGEVMNDPNANPLEQISLV